MTNTIQKNSQISKIVSLSVFLGSSRYIMSYSEKYCWAQGRILGVGAGGAHPPWDDLRFSNTTGILQKKKKTMRFVGVEVEQEKSTPPPKKNPGSAPVITL